MEKIEIQDFAGIKDISIEVKQINILIGPQASGKSIIAKLLYYFKNFVIEILNAALNSKTKRDLDKDFKLKFIEFFPSSSWGKKNFKIRYYINKEYIEISRKILKDNNKTSLKLSYSELYKVEFAEWKKVIKKYKKKEIEQENKSGLPTEIDLFFSIRRTFLSVISNSLDRTAAFSQLYIPAGRAFFANLKSSIFAFLSENNAIDSFLVEFAKYYETAKNPKRLELLQKNIKNIELNNEIAILNKKILCGKYLQKDGEDYLKIDDNRQINIANSSSGQQESLPLSIILGTIAHKNPHIGGNSIYIEEPEAHIFPAAQKNIVELISTVYNARKDSLQFFIITHSPYILTAFNNLLQAGILSIDATEEKIEQISNLVPKTRFLKPGEVAVYSLENGYCQSIIDEETGLIDAKIIDEVSNELAIQFDELLELEE